MFQLEHDPVRSNVVVQMWSGHRVAQSPIVAKLLIRPVNLLQAASMAFDVKILNQSRDDCYEDLPDEVIRSWNGGWALSLLGRYALNEVKIFSWDLIM
jgi:hypothetical protein